jgi:hypothetical protein
MAVRVHGRAFRECHAENAQPGRAHPIVLGQDRRSLCLGQRLVTAAFHPTFTKREHFRRVALDRNEGSPLLIGA